MSEVDYEDRPTDPHPQRKTEYTPLAPVKKIVCFPDMVLQTIGEVKIGTVVSHCGTHIYHDLCMLSNTLMSLLHQAGQ